MKLWGQAENMQLENKSSDYAAGPVGRIWWNTATTKVKVDDGTNIRALLRNDGFCLIGNNGTAANNIRFHRGASGVLQFVTGDDVTAEGSLSTTLNQISCRIENYATGSLPAAANAGRPLWDTTLAIPKWDTGAAIKNGVLADATQQLTNKDIDGGTASNSLRITLPKNTTGNLTALTRKQGTLVYDTTTSAVKFDDGSNLVSLATSVTSPSSAGDYKNYTLTATVAASALTVSLKTLAGADPSSGDPVLISFRSATAATGDYTVVSAVAATTVVVSSGSTLGHASALAEYIYVYAINNAGTIELAVSSSRTWDEGSVQSTTAEGGAGAADSKTAIYSTTARASKAVRFLGRLQSTQATAGTWATGISEISLFPSDKGLKQNSEVWVYTRNTVNPYGSSSTAIPRWTTVGKNTGTAITYADSATLGGTFTITEDGDYGMHLGEQFSASQTFGISLNSSQLSTNIGSITQADRLVSADTFAAGAGAVIGVELSLKVGDVIRPHYVAGQASGASTGLPMFRIKKLN